LQLQAEQPMTLSSDEDDVDVRRVLTFVVAMAIGLTPRVRLDCVESAAAAVRMSKRVRLCSLPRVGIRIRR